MSYDNDMSGALFKNNKKEKPTHPDYTVKCEISGFEFWISAWIKEGKDGKFMSLAFKEKETPNPIKAPPATRRDSDLDMHSTTLYEPAQAHRIIESLKPRLMAGQRLSLSVGEEKRNLPQNAKLHATISDIARTCEWAGKKWDAEVWKRMLIAAWCRTRNEAPIIIQALDGHGVDAVYRRSSELTKAECSELLEYVICWAAEHAEQEQTRA